MEHISKINFHPLYRTAQYLCVAMLILIPVQIIIFVISPPPDTIMEFFELYSQNAFLGLLSLDFIYLFNNMMIVIIYLALAAQLFFEKPVTVLLALVFGLIGVACYYPSNPAFEILTLSRQYFQAAPPQQAIYLAAGEALLAGYTGTSFDVYYVLSTLCLLLFSYTIFKSSQFKKSVGFWGLVSGFFMIIPSSAGAVGIIFSLASLPPWLIFVALLMRNFKQLAISNQSIARGYL